MWRDLWRYLRALRKHFGGLLTGAFVTGAFIVWQYVLKKGDIPTWVLVVAAVAGLFISGFKPWREEHAKVSASVLDPEMELRRQPLEREVPVFSSTKWPFKSAGPGFDPRRARRTS